MEEGGPSSNLCSLYYEIQQTFTKNKTFTLCMAALGRREEKEEYNGRERRGKWKGNSFPFMCLYIGREGEQKRSKCLLLLFAM